MSDLPNGSGRVARWLLGPEMYWLAVALAMKVLAARNAPPTPAGNALLERFWWILAFALVPACFLVLLVPGALRSSTLWRIVLATFVGLCVAASYVTGGIDYRDSRNSGTFAGWMMSVMFGGLLVVVLAVIGGIVLLRRRA